MASLKYNGSRIARANSKPCPATETRRSIARLGRFNRLFSIIPAERFAVICGFFQLYSNSAASPFVGRGRLARLIALRTKAAFLSYILNPFTQLDVKGTDQDAHRVAFISYCDILKI